MKKIVLAAFILGSICLGSCKKDSPAPTPVPTELATKILGKWKLDKQTKETTGQQTITTTFTEYQIEFKNDGTHLHYYTDPQTMQTTITESTYSIKNETTFSSGDVDRTVTTIDDHNLIYYNYSNGTTKLTFYLSK